MDTRRPEESGPEVRGHTRNKPVTPGKGSGSAPRQRLSRSRRITSTRDIRAMFQRGKRSRTAHLDVFDSDSPFAFPRVGIVVPKHRRNSVERNLLKRRLREILRLEVLPRLRVAGAKPDILVRARKEAYLATFPQLRDELIAWIERKWSVAS